MRSYYYRVYPFSYGKPEARRVAEIDLAVYGHDHAGTSLISTDHWSVCPDLDALVEPSPSIVSALRSEIHDRGRIPEGRAVHAFQSKICENPHEKKILITWGDQDAGDLTLRFASYRNLLNPYDWHGAKNNNVLRRKDAYGILLAAELFGGQEFGVASANTKREALRNAMDALDVRDVDPLSAVAVREVFKSAYQLRQASPSQAGDVSSSLVALLFRKDQRLPRGAVMIYLDGKWLPAYVADEMGDRARLALPKEGQDGDLQFRIKSLSSSFTMWLSREDIKAVHGDLRRFDNMLSIFNARHAAAKINEALASYERKVRESSGQAQDPEMALYDVKVYSNDLADVWLSPKAPYRDLDRVKGIAARTDLIGVLARRVLLRLQGPEHSNAQDWEWFVADARKRLLDPTVSAYTILDYDKYQFALSQMDDPIVQSIIAHNAGVRHIFGLGGRQQPSSDEYAIAP